MLKEIVTLTYQEWLDQYKPDAARFGSHTLSPEPYLYQDEDYPYVAEHDYRLVWTLCEADGELFISNGKHLVNRLGYYCCLNTWDEKYEHQVEFNA